jgi:hypothetical protein
MMLQTIQSAEPLPESRIKLVWGDGAESVVDLAPVLAEGGVFAFLREPPRSTRSRSVRAAALWCGATRRATRSTFAPMPCGGSRNAARSKRRSLEPG